MNFSNLLNKSLFLSIPLFRKIVSAVTGSPAWLEDAMEFDIYKSKSKRVRRLVNEIYFEVSQYIKVSNSAKAKEAIKSVLLNLWMGAFFNRPIRYSRNNNDYSSVKRYGQLFMTIAFLIPVIDTFEELGYIQKQKWFFISKKNFGRQTRMWATEMLLQRFEKAGLCEYGFFTGNRPKDSIILNKKIEGQKKKKKKIKYIDTPKTNKWRAQLEKYNSYIDNSKITVVLNGEALVNIRFLIQFLYQYIIKGTVRINTVKLSKLNPPNQYDNQYHHNTNSIYYHYILSTMTKRKHWKHKSTVPINESTEAMMLHHYLADVNVIVRAFDDSDGAESFLNQRVLLKDIGIEHLEFQLVYEYLHRVFNDGSFRRGGRFYGALHLSLPKDLRRFIYIGGHPTIELDYSAFHIKMLYHKEGIDYQDDPYTICEGELMRKEYKSVGLIAINAKKKKAYKAIYDTFIKKGLQFPKRDEPIVSMVKTFKETHKDIRKHLFTGVGTLLQNIDGDIMNSILARLLEMDIVGLPVHDSVIVAAQHKDVLENLMIEEYEKRMGFKPVVDIK